MERELTPKQEKFIHGVLSGLSQSEAYRRAYNAKNMSVEKIAKKASDLANRGDIGGIIDQRRREMADKAIWSREQALEMLRDIAEEAKEAAAVVVDGEVVGYNSKNAGAAIKAIAEANKMCGYNAPDSLNVAVGAKLEDLIK